MAPMKNDNSVILFIICLIVVIDPVKAQPHTDKNVTVTETLFSSPGYTDSLDYGINTTRDYRFHTNYPNHTLKLTVIEFVMEIADKNQDCLYDKVTVYDGFDATAPVLHVLCDTIAPGTTYVTSGDTVYVVFYSDATNVFKGFQMSVVSDGPTTTTSTTTTTTTPTPTTSTIKSSNQPTTTANPNAQSTTVNPNLSTQNPGNSQTGATNTPGNSQNSGGSGDYTIWVIVGCCIGGVLLIAIVVVVIIVCYMKSKRPVTPGKGDHVKRVLWSRSNTTVVKPIDMTKTSVPPGEVVQTNIFDLELPKGDGKANLLPPLSSALGIPEKPGM